MKTQGRVEALERLTRDLSNVDQQLEHWFRLNPHEARRGEIERYAAAESLVQVILFLEKIAKGQNPPGRSLNRLVEALAEIDAGREDPMLSRTSNQSNPGTPNFTLIMRGKVAAVIEMLKASGIKPREGAEFAFRKLGPDVVAAMGQDKPHSDGPSWRTVRDWYYLCNSADYSKNQENFDPRDWNKQIMRAYRDETRKLIAAFELGATPKASAEKTLQVIASEVRRRS